MKINLTSFGQENLANKCTNCRSDKIKNVITSSKLVQ